MMTEMIRVTADGSEPELTDEPADVHVSGEFSHPRYGRKLKLDLIPPWEDDGECKDVTMEMEWRRTHRAWDDVANAWTADFDQLNHVVDHYTDAGYDVTVTVEVARSFEAEGMIFMPEHRGDDEADETPDGDDDSMVPRYTTHEDHEGDEYVRCTECGDERLCSHGGADEMFHYEGCSEFEGYEDDEDSEGAEADETPDGDDEAHDMFDTCEGCGIYIAKGSTTCSDCEEPREADEPEGDDEDDEDPEGVDSAMESTTDGGYEIPDGYQLTKANPQGLEFTRMADMKHVGVVSDPEDTQWVVESDIPGGDDGETYPVIRHNTRVEALEWAREFMGEQQAA